MIDRYSIQTHKHVFLERRAGALFYRQHLCPGEEKEFTHGVLRPVGFEPTRFGETVGLKSTPLDHSGRSALFYGR